MMRPQMATFSMLGIGLGLVVALTALTPAPVEASGKTARFVAGLAVGALVYAALDDNSRSGRSHGSGCGCNDCRRYCPPNPNPRYDPPGGCGWGPYPTPREAYDNGYDDGFRDGRDTGRREGYNSGWNNGYRTGYSDGRTDERYSGRVGRPYTRPVSGPGRAYGYY